MCVCINANKAKQSETKPIESHLFNGGDRDDEEERQSAGDGAGGSVDDQLESGFRETLEQQLLKP